MQVKLMKSKIHRATVTQSDLHYEGSIGIDEDLLEAAGILPFESVHVWNVNNAERFETYALPLRRGSREVCVNGAAARLAQAGDLVIVATFCWIDEQEARGHQPSVLLLGEGNAVQSRKP
jgi:aspartate 1-decarboxylase